MQRLTIITCLIVALTTQSRAQVLDLVRFEEKTKSKIQVGMTPDEVKRVLGRPQAIQGGFPKSETTIIADLPEQVGQINNSTWFYFYPHLTVKVDEPKKTLYTVNGLEVPEDLFDTYVGAELVYIYKGQIVHPEAGKSYESLRDVNLRIVKKNADRSSVQHLPARRVSKSFLPIFAVIFDKGTLVVADTKVFFKIAPR
jgi:hypothetical protein